MSSSGRSRVAEDSVSTRGISFVIPLGERNGATTALLHFLRWFKANGRRPFSILAAQDGELISEYGKLADTWTADRSHWCPGGLRAQGLGALGLGRWAQRAERADLRRFAGRCSPGLIYVNSVTREGARLVELLELRIPVLMHVHALEFFLHREAGSALPWVLSQAKQFIACSDAVRENLIRRHGITPDRIETVHEAIPVEEVCSKRTRAEILQELQLPDGALLVAACGNLYWGKGADLFVQLARAVCRQSSCAYFVWMGQTEPQEVARFRHDVRLLGLEQRVRLTGAVRRSADYLAAADVFVLTSREDSFPLVCLEAAALGKPIVCFREAGGMPEFVQQDCGFVVPYLDVAAMSEALICLLDSPECRLKMGEAARRKVIQRHDISVAAPRIMDIIERTAAVG
jgi:glycosyltransferase involved in cell wall biosynthesis